ncbi:hypothetical protein BC832DRAFT_389266 [Gaertneriomyces semiglobifer]|nr:hypothetical protein BC832DRAFT_389266 [Gaertneriomyces semiglobifer]
MSFNGYNGAPPAHGSNTSLADLIARLSGASQQQLQQSQPQSQQQQSQQHSQQQPPLAYLSQQQQPNHNDAPIAFSAYPSSNEVSSTLQPWQTIGASQPPSHLYQQSPGANTQLTNDIMALLSGMAAQHQQPTISMLQQLPQPISTQLPTTPLHQLSTADDPIGQEMGITHQELSTVSQNSEPSLSYMPPESGEIRAGTGKTKAGISPAVLVKLAQLGESGVVTPIVKGLQASQSALEDSLMEKRRAIQHRHENDLAAKEILGNVTLQQKKHAMRLMKKELQEFDKQIFSELERLRARQQGELERAEIPNFRVTNDIAAMSTQQQILSILLGMMEE